MDKLSKIHWILLVSRRLVLLLEEESSPCLAFFPAEGRFQLNFHSPSRQTLLVKRERQCLVLKQRPHPVDHFASRIQHLQVQQTPDTRLCPTLLKHPYLNVLRPPFLVLPAGWGWLQLALNGCSRTVVFETTTNCKLPEDFLGNLLSFLGRDLLQSQSLNLAQGRKTTH